MDDRLATFVTLLQKHQQSHLLQFADQLTPQQQAGLAAQLADVDWELMASLVGGAGDSEDWARRARRAQPPPAIRPGEPQPAITREAARQAGQQAIRQGRVGLILVAGGQGTRLGFDHPKGVLPIGPLTGRTLFQMHCDRLRAVGQRHQCTIPLLIMTSPATDQETRAYFQSQRNCGLDPQQLTVFCQGTMPAVDAANGQLLLADKDSLALSPDGHGGLLAALRKSGCLDRCARDGVDFLFYAQVDNPLAPLCDPELIGYHLLSRSQVTTQVVRKRFAQEKVGNVVSIDGKIQIIEYSDLPDELARQQDEDGSLRLWAGNIAVHVFDREFLQAVVGSAGGLPFHRALKKVPFIDSQGRRAEPERPNAVKFERFVFDLLPLADRAVVVEADAAEVFAPVKNANGAEVDTPEHCQQALLANFRRWIEAAGSTVDSDVRVEITPHWALDAAEVAQKLVNPVHFSADTVLS